MNKLTAGALALCLPLVFSFPAQSFEPLVVYDDFDGPGINPDLWDPRFIEPAQLDVVREITKGGKLRLFARAYGNTFFTGGRNSQTLRLSFKNSNDVSSIESWVRVQSASALGCSDFTGTSSRIGYRIGGYYFNDGRGGLNNATGDMFASFELRRSSNSMAPEGELQIVGNVFHCGDPDCNGGTDLFFSTTIFGTALVGRKVKLLLEYDRETNSFIFQRDSRAPIILIVPSTIPNMGPPAFPKRIDVRSNVENCSATPRPVVDMDVDVLQIRTNESALPVLP